MKLIPFLLTIIFVSSFSQTNGSSELRKMESINSRLEQLKRNLQKINKTGKQVQSRFQKHPHKAAKLLRPLWQDHQVKVFHPPLNQ